MTTTLVIAIALAVFLAGLYLGHRLSVRRNRRELERTRRHYMQMVEQVFDHTDAEALDRTLALTRDPTGEIIDIRDRPVRCGTPILMVQELLYEQRRRKALH